MTPTIDPTLAALYRAACESKAARPILADWLAEAGDEEAASLARDGLIGLALRKYHGHYFGYYSAEHAGWHGSWIYATPDGDEAEITLVNAVPIAVRKEYGWPDWVYVGPVTDVIRRGRVEMSDRWSFGDRYLPAFPSPRAIVYTNLS